MRLSFWGKVGALGSIASVVGLMLYILNPTQEQPSNKTTGANSPIVNAGGNVSIVSGGFSDQEKFNPNYNDISFINQLIEINSTAYFIGHQKWDTGITQDAIEGNLAVQDIYLDATVQLAHLYYPPMTFGPDIDEYFRTKVNQKLARFRTLYKTLSSRLGSMETMIASSDGRDYLEAKIKEMVKHVADNNSQLDYANWEKRWEAAKSQ